MEISIIRNRWREETCESCLYCVDEECKLNAAVHFYSMYEGHLAVWPNVVIMSVEKKYHKACAKWIRNKEG